MKSRYIVTLAAVCSAWSLAAQADRDPGWEFGGELIYQDSTDIRLPRVARALDLDSDLGIALTFGYRMSERLELTFGLDWNNVDYNANMVSDGPARTSPPRVQGELESFTPRVGVNFNFLEGPITPVRDGMIGYSLHRHQHSGRPGAGRLLVGSLVRPDLRHLAAHAQCRRIHVRRRASACAGTSATPDRCASATKSTGSTRQRQHARTSTSSSSACQSVLNDRGRAPAATRGGRTRGVDHATTSHRVVKRRLELAAHGRPRPHCWPCDRWRPPRTPRCSPATRSTRSPTAPPGWCCSSRRWPRSASSCSSTSFRRRSPRRKQHPQLDAIKTLCLLSLVFGGMLWPLAWLWAYTKPVIHKLAYGTDQDAGTIGGSRAARRRSTRTSARRRSLSHGTHPARHLLVLRLADFLQVQMAAVEFRQPGHRRHDPHRRPDAAHPAAEHRRALVGGRARDQLRGRGQRARPGHGDRGADHAEPATSSAARCCSSSIRAPSRSRSQGFKAQIDVTATPSC